MGRGPIYLPCFASQIRREKIFSQRTDRIDRAYRYTPASPFCPEARRMGNGAHQMERFRSDELRHCGGTAIRDVDSKGQDDWHWAH